MTFLLAACGGGGGGGGGETPPPTTPPPSGGPNPPPTDPPTTPSDPNAENLANAQNARLRMALNAPQLMVTWIDKFDNESGYEVQRRVGTGEWQVVEALPALAGGTTQWNRTIDTTATYRVIVKIGDLSLPLYAAADESEITVEYPPATYPTVQFNQTEPVSAEVQISVANAGPALSVAYLLDFSQFAFVNSGDSFPATLPAAQLLDGQHSILAIIQKTAGYSIWRGRQLMVDNPAPAVLLSVNPPRLPGDQITLRAAVSSDAGIAAVEFFANGNSLGVVTAPNSGLLWTLQVDPALVPAGATTFRAVATDNNAATASHQVQTTLDYVPSLQVEGPIDGMITSGPLSIRGEFGDDVDGAVLSVTLGDRLLARTTVSPFNIDASLTDVPPGEYSLVVRAQDIRGKVNSVDYNVIVSSTGLTYELVATDVQLLLAADNGTVLYRKGFFGAFALRNANGVETELQVPPSLSASQWWLHDGRIAALNGPNNHIYVFTQPNQAVNVSAQTGTAASGVVQRGSWLSWRASGLPQFTVYNLLTGASTQVMHPGLASPVSFDFIPTPGNERLLFATTGGLYSHPLATGTTTQLASGVYYGIQTDGTSVAYLDDSTVARAPLSNLTATRTFSRGGLQQHDLDAGLLYLFYASGALHADDGVTTATVSVSDATPFARSVADGHVIFSENLKLYTWSVASGKRLLLDTLPAQALQADGIAYLRTGDTGLLYRVTLP